MRLPPPPPVGAAVDVRLPELPEVADPGGPLTSMVHIKAERRPPPGEIATPPVSDAAGVPIALTQILFELMTKLPKIRCAMPLAWPAVTLTMLFSYKIEPAPPQDLAGSVTRNP